MQILGGDSRRKNWRVEMKKKIIAIMLSLTMCVGLSACGSGSDGNSERNRDASRSERIENTSEESRNQSLEDIQEPEAQEEAQEEATKEELFKNLVDEKTDNADVNAFDTIKFGHYEQDNDTANGAEEIEWLVLAKEEDRMLVISRYVLDCQPYNIVQHDSVMKMQKPDVTWETCTLRNWLNDSFYNMAFSDEEQGKIVTVTNINPDASGFDESWEGKGGSNTDDKVFYLSYKEALAYFETDEARRCLPTAYAEAQGVVTKEVDDGSTFSCSWVLRSPGESQDFVMFVTANGSLSYGIYNNPSAVRPAMWISLN